MSGVDSGGTSEDTSVQPNDTYATIEQICYYGPPMTVPTLTDIGIYLLAFILIGIGLRKLYIVKL